MRYGPRSFEGTAAPPGSQVDPWNIRRQDTIRRTSSVTPDYTRCTQSCIVPQIRYMCAIDEYQWQPSCCHMIFHEDITPSHGIVLEIL